MRKRFKNLNITHELNLKIGTLNANKNILRLKGEEIFYID